jgi:HSP20 family protein
MYNRNQRQAMFNPAAFAQINPAAVVNPWKLMQALLAEEANQTPVAANQGDAANAEASPKLAPTPKLQPAVDVFDTGAAYLIEANLPGVKREDVQLSLEGRTLKLSAKQAVRENNLKTLWHERASGEISRTITLPSLINSENVEAKLEDGVLSITVAKANEAQTKQIVIQG